MGIRMNSSFSLVHKSAIFIGRRLPYKDSMKKLYYSFRNNLNDADRLIESTEIVNGLLKAKMNNGMIFYYKPHMKAEQHDEQMSFSGKLKDIEHCYQFYYMICEHFLLNTFQPERGDTVIDAGANIGIFAIKASRLVGENGRVIAIEPDKENISLLKRNIAENGCHNITIIESALSNNNGTTTLYRNDCESHNIFGGNGESIVVRTTTLDKLIEKERIVQIGFLKMDIEGAEEMALREGQKALAICNKIAIDTYHKQNSNVREWINGFSTTTKHGTIMGERIREIYFPKEVRI